jgi:putative NIF3 family GTP cyclohydrolase 1 type 2
MSISRRTFNAALTAAAVPLFPAVEAQERLTCRQVIERIQKHVGVPWKEPTVDTFKAGNPDSPVIGIATTMMSTLDVLQRAAAAKCNLIISHEPTFYGHLDKTEELAVGGDPVYAVKSALIKEHGLVVWRFHDHWHLRRPDGILTGVVRALEWGRYQSTEEPQRFTLPATTVGRLAADLKRRLKIRTLRVVGDAGMPVTKAALSPGSGGFAAHLKQLQSDEVEVLVIGEAHEWETVEYVADAVAAKKRKALIVLGHVPSEQAGMEDCARWLKTFISEAPIRFIPTAEPFWSPG